MFSLRCVERGYFQLSYYPVDSSSQNEYGGRFVVAVKCSVVWKNWRCGRTSIRLQYNTNARMHQYTTAHTNTTAHREADVSRERTSEYELQSRNRTIRYVTCVATIACMSARRSLCAYKTLTSTGTRTPLDRDFERVVLRLCVCVATTHFTSHRVIL